MMTHPLIKILKHNPMLAKGVTCLLLGGGYEVTNIYTLYNFAYFSSNINHFDPRDACVKVFSIGLVSMRLHHSNFLSKNVPLNRSNVTNASIFYFLGAL